MTDMLFQIFPADDIEALAMLYVKSQDLSNLTPEALVELYDKTYATIAEIRKQQRYVTETWI